jgi:hypothetical protein
MIKKNCKGQTEIIGLVIIVLLISIGLMIAFFVFSKPVGKEVVHQQKGLFASDFLSTLVRSDADCRGRTVGELIQNSLEHGSIFCESGVSFRDQAKFLVKDFIDIFLDNEFRRFYFAVVDKEGNVFSGMDDFVFGIKCKGEFESKSRPLVFSGGVVYLRFDLCS